MDEEDYWTMSESRAFSFDEDELVKKSQPKALSMLHSVLCTPQITERESSRGIHRVITDDNYSERSYESSSNEIPLSALISPQDLRKGN